MWVLLSRQLRRWIVLALVVPVVGRLLQRASGRIGQRNPRAGAALASTGQRLQRRGRRSRR